MDLKDQQFQVEVFEGPLDLLLFLIRKSEIDLYDIPIQTLTRQYLDYLELMKMLDLDIAAEFLSMAATLMHLKSRLLLPPEEREEEEEKDPRWDLVRQLLEYKRFKEAARNLNSLQENQELVFSRTGEKISSPVSGQEPLGEVGIFELLDAFSAVLKRVSDRQPSELEPEPFTLDDGFKRVLGKVTGGEGVSFTALFEPEETRVRIVVIFLAVLELIRRKVIRAVQEINFGRLRIYPGEDNFGTQGNS